MYPAGLFLMCRLVRMGPAPATERRARRSRAGDPRLRSRRNRSNGEEERDEPVSTSSRSGRSSSGAAVFFYVLLDGFDLGVGMLYGFAPDTTSRNT